MLPLLRVQQETGEGGESDSGKIEEDTE